MGGNVTLSKCEESKNSRFMDPSGRCPLRMTGIGERHPELDSGSPKVMKRYSRRRACFGRSMIEMLGGVGDNRRDKYRWNINVPTGDRYP